MSKIKQIAAVILTAAFILGGIVSELPGTKGHEVNAVHSSADQIEEVLYPTTEKQQ